MDLLSKLHLDDERESEMPSLSSSPTKTPSPPEAVSPINNPVSPTEPIILQPTPVRPAGLQVLSPPALPSPDEDMQELRRQEPEHLMPRIPTSFVDLTKENRQMQEVIIESFVGESMMDLLNSPVLKAPPRRVSAYQKARANPLLTIAIPKPPLITGLLTRTLIHRFKGSPKVIRTTITFTEDPNEDCYKQFIARVTESAGMEGNKEMKLGYLVIDWDNGASAKENDGVFNTGSGKISHRIDNQEDWASAVRKMREQSWCDQGWSTWWWENKGGMSGLYF